PFPRRRGSLRAARCLLLVRVVCGARRRVRRRGSPAGSVAADDVERLVQDAAQVRDRGLADPAGFADDVADPVGEVVQDPFEPAACGAVLRPFGPDPAEGVGELLPLAVPRKPVLALPVPALLLLVSGPAPDVVGTGLRALLPLRAAPPRVLGGGLPLFAQVADGVADVALDRLGDVPHRFGDLPFQVFEVPFPFPQFCAALVGEPVDLAPVDLFVGHEPFLFEAGQARVDGSGRRRVDPQEPVPQQADDLVAVPGAFVQQFQQVQAESAVAEDGGHASPFGIAAGVSAARRSSEVAPETVVVVIVAGSIPGPIVPLSRVNPRVLCRSRPNAESRRPVAERSSTVAEVSAGTRSAISPEMLPRVTRAAGARSMSARSSPEAVLADSSES